MAELTAVVSVHDKASSKFQTMKESARRFEMQLNDVSRELDVINAKLVALTSRRWTIHLDTDRNTLGPAAGALAGGLGPVPGPNGLMMPSHDAVNMRGQRHVDSDPVDELKNALPRGDERRRSNLAGVGSGGGVRAFNRMVLIPIIKASARAGELAGEALGSGFFKLFTGLAADQMKDVPKTVKFLGKLGKGIGALAAIAAFAVPIVTALSMGLAVLGNIIFSLAVPIAAIIPLLTAVGASLAFAVVPMFMWISKTKQLVDQKKQLREQLSRLTPGTAEYAAKLKELNEVQKDLDKNGGEYIYTKAMELWEKAKDVIFNPKNTQMFVDTLDSILRALEPLIPIVSDLIYKFTGVFKGLFDELGAWFKSSEGGSWFDRVFGPDMVQLVGTLGRGIGFLVELFGELSAAIAPVANVLFEKLNNWMDGLSGRLKSGESDLGGWLMAMMNTFTLLMSTLGQGIKDIANFLADPVIQMYTQKFLNWFKDMVPKAMSFFKDTIVKYGPITIEILKFIGNNIRVAWTVLSLLFDVLKPLGMVFFKLSNVFLPLLNTALDKLGPAFEFVGETIKKFFIGPLEIVKWLIEKITSAWDKLKNSWIGKLTGKVVGIFDGGDPEEEAKQTLPAGMTGTYGVWDSDQNKSVRVENVHLHNTGTDAQFIQGVKRGIANSVPGFG